MIHLAENGTNSGKGIVYFELTMKLNPSGNVQESFFDSCKKSTELDNAKLVMPYFQ